MIQEFTTYLVTNLGYSQHTAIAYGKDLKAFAKWMKQERPTAKWSDVEQPEIEAYVASMHANGKKAATINRHIASLRRAYYWMMKDGRVKKNPARYIQAHKVAKTIPNTIPTSDLIQAMKTATGTLHLMLTLMTATGIRVQEMLDIEKSDIEAQAGRVKIHGKGMKERYVYLREEAMRELAAYAQGRPERIFGNIDQRDVRTAVWQHLRTTSTARQLSPHAIRHTYATEMARRGYNETTIAKVLGHESTKTTRKYINMASQDARSAQLTFSMTE